MDYESRNHLKVEKILVPLKGTEHDECALQLAIGLTRGSKGVVYLLYVVEVERKAPVDAEVVPAIATGEDVLKQAEHWLKKHRLEKTEFEAELMQARLAGPAIVQEAVERKVNAIVMIASYRNRYGSYGLGDTIPYVLRNAPCRVVLWQEPTGYDSYNAVKT